MGATNSVDLKLKVVLVTTRAALRHADGSTGPGQRRAIVRRGRALVDHVAQQANGTAGSAVKRARDELDKLERS